MGLVELLTADGSEKAELVLLSENDQAYIQNWYAAFSILDKRIKITTRKKSEGAKGAKERLWYEFEIVSKTRNTTVNLIIEYCIFSQTEIQETTQPGGWGDYGFNATGPAVERPDQLISDNKSGTILLTVPYREEIKHSTEEISFYDNYRISNGGANLEIRESELLGIRYRVYLPTPNGEYAMMEFAEPEELLEETEWPSE